MRLTLVINSLAAGGAERVLSVLANAWAARGHDVTLITYDDGRRAFYELDKDVRRQPLGLAGASTGFLSAVGNNLRRIRRLRAELRRGAPDCVVSFVDQVNVLTAIAAIGTGSRVVVCERVDPAMAPISPTWRTLRNRTYRLADVVVVQTRAAIASLPASGRARAVIIPNPVRAPGAVRSTRTRLRRLVLGIGRLVPQKGFDLLLAAFARLQGRFSDWDLVILGEGPLQAELAATVAREGLSDRVRLAGLTSTVDEYLAQADVFVLPSRFEGFPNALCEAMSWGVASIAADCPSGPREIVQDGVDGVLVPPEDVPALTAALARLMSSDAERTRLGARAREVSHRYNLDAVLAAWDIAIRSPKTPASR